MTIAIAHCRAQLGIEAPAVAIETHLSNGLVCKTEKGQRTCR